MISQMLKIILTILNLNDAQLEYSAESVYFYNSLFTLKSIVIIFTAEKMYNHVSLTADDIK